MSATPGDVLTIVEAAVDAHGWRARLRVEADSRAFDGHFPGEPVLPGIAQLLVVTQALRLFRDPPARLRELASVRWRRIVRPGDVLEVVMSNPDGEGWSRFEMRVGLAVVTTGRARSAADA
ncbi:MAG TPA: hypothetical protein VGQ33_00765 [Vicinamibacteria bacterium]|nr:hypothetical protein [Vicinamibacteria bacterium]